MQMEKQMGRQMEKFMVLEPPWGAFNNDALCDQVVRPYRVTRESLLPSSLLDLRGTCDVINLGSIVERERDAKRRLWLVEYDALCDQVVRLYRVTRESLLPSSLHSEMPSLS